MFTKVFIALGIAILLFLAYLAVKVYMPSWFENDTFSVKKAPVHEDAPWIKADEQPEDGVTTPGGPSTPAMKAMPQNEETQPPVVTASDPFVEVNSSSDIQNNLRNPERMFSPGIKPQNTTAAVMSGVGSNESHVTAQALQTFVPEMAQNGGEFMKGIAANDTLGDAEYAAF